MQVQYQKIRGQSSIFLPIFKEPAISRIWRCYSEAEVNGMPIHGYFSKRDNRKLTVPRSGEGAPGAGGLALHGDVLTGKLSVQEAFAREAARLSQTPTPGNRAKPENYDPVLKSHLGIE